MNCILVGKLFTKCVCFLSGVGVMRYLQLNCEVVTDEHFKPSPCRDDHSILKWNLLSDETTQVFYFCIPDA